MHIIFKQKRLTQKIRLGESHLRSVWSPALARGETQNLGPEALRLLGKHILPGTWAGAKFHDKWLFWLYIFGTCK